ncbi:hypothetical protein GGTG_10487 [Gaeumannomyces tritici R3-111a-1]|uniref:Uncharacterized protein n=1 Tax=Gaeumannomyces tritici (strain R3-111a-1) TaxID=644352 RepID=J3PAG1_GAET3|nr:hypothetical protein GGTG_10487 [Gaeumannomyces tritici R3-111a-1]EJT71227.1 hypothetical protein GGTG_10487 [Gaeumannomyces tritici R3-111a-1]
MIKAAHQAGGVGFLGRHALGFPHCAGLALGLPGLAGGRPPCQTLAPVRLLYQGLAKLLVGAGNVQMQGLVPHVLVDRDAQAFDGLLAACHLGP